MRESIGDWVRQPQQVVVPWDVTISMLMNTKRVQEVRWRLFRLFTPCRLPAECLRLLVLLRTVRL